MKNILRLFAGGFIAAFLAHAAMAADLVPAAYSAGTVKGDVTYKLAGSSEYMPLTAGTALPQGVTIKTGANSSALIVFASGSTAAVTAGSEVEITKFEQEVFSGPVPADSEPAVSNTEIRIINGDVVNKVAKLKKGSSYTVNSPVGAAGVRGTTFKVSYNATTGAYTIDVVEGEVVLASVSGQTVPVTGGRRLVGTRQNERRWEFQEGEIPAEALRDIMRSIGGVLGSNREVRQSLRDGDGMTIIIDVNQLPVSPN